MNRFKILVASLLFISLFFGGFSAIGQQCFNYYSISPTGTICGSSTDIILSGSTYGVTYQLMVNGSNYGSPVNGNGSSLDLGTVTSAGANGGGTFTVMASQYGGTCSPTVIAGGSLYFTPTPGGTVSQSSTLVCPNGPVTLTANPTTSGNYYYQWYLNGSPLSNATNQTYSATSPGNYSVNIGNSCGSATINAQAISASPSVGQPGAITGTTSRIAGAGTSTYNCGAANNAHYYTWQISPSTAGTATGGFNPTTTITWNPDFYGTAIISVTATGQCGPPSSPTFLCVPVDLTGASSYSYVQETDVRVPNIVSLTSISSLPIGQKTVTFTYNDQGGRPIQKVSQSATPGFNDMVQPIAYDPAGRKITGYLPYSVPGTNNGAYVANPLSNQAIYYNPNTPGASNIATSTNSTSESIYDNSPSERIVEQGYPGLTWIQGGGHSVKTLYATNATNEVMNWMLNPASNGASYSYYNSGTLLATTVIDENGNSVTQYKDFNGNMVCKKTQSGPSTYLYTYYVYDDSNNLRFVIPPLPTVPVSVSLPYSFTESDAVFNNFFYGYHYDARNRLIEKKIPGKGWEYYVYNRLDQVILSQTPTQQTLGIWLFTKYDAQGRAILSGDYTTAATRSTLQNNADVFPSTLLSESFTNVTSNYGYTDTSYPDYTVGASKKVLSVSYYDNYAFLSNSTVNPNAAIFIAPSIDTIYTTPQGLLTGSITNVLGASTPTYLLSINQYDKQGRVVETIGQSFKSGSTNSGNYDIIQNQYSFTNLLIKSSRSHYLSSVPQVVIATFYGYDQVGRKILLQQQYNSGSLISLAKYDYNEIGQLITKSLHSTNSSRIPASSTFLQHLNYQYNMRGWLNSINNPGSSTLADPAFSGQTDLFAEEIDYDQPNPAFSGTTPQYNGNISTQSWQTLSSPYTTMVQELKGYVFNYDQLNRMTSAYYKAPSGNDKYNEVITYDELGNILSLNRNATASTYLNKLTYDYGSGTQRGNILLDVQDNGGTEAYNSTFSYQSGSGSETGNTKTNVQQITYNELNLPSVITFSTGKTITFNYSSTGEQLERKIVQGGTVAEDRSYIHGIEYVAGGMEYIHTEEGRARPSSSSYTLEYQITDHLGNVRAIFGDEDSNGLFTATDIAQATDYYAFGREIPYLEGNPLFQYKFNGKEYSSDLNEYNYGARFFNPVTARWNAVDNAAEKGRRWSPYTYVNNNPLRNIDPDGNWGGGFADAYNDALNVRLSIVASPNSFGRQETDDQMIDDYNNGFTSYDPSSMIFLKKQSDYMAQKVIANATDWMKMYGPGNRDGDLFTALNGGASSAGFNSKGFGNALAHLTPFGGVIDFANAAKSGNVGGAILGLASSAAFFTGEGEVASLKTINAVASSGAESSLAESSQFVYRGITAENAVTINQGQGIFAKAPAGEWSLEQHLTFGSSQMSYSNDPWIATSSQYNIAKSFNGGNGIVTIDLNQIPSNNIKIGWQDLGRTSPGYHYSIWQQEISIFGNIPQAAIMSWDK